MSSAADFRRTARESLVGKWRIAILVGLIASLFGVAPIVGLDCDVTDVVSGYMIEFKFANQTFCMIGGQSGLSPVNIIGIGVLIGVFLFLVGNLVAIGYAGFHLKIVDRKDGEVKDLFSYFSYWKTILTTKLLQGLCLILWGFLLIIPGIMASYSYAMVDYILAENPKLSANEAITVSKEMMEGKRWRLFCLELSFIGWRLLCILTLGIGNLWLIPYVETARAVFYREISAESL